MSPQARKQITLERTFDGTIEEVWDLWTTAEGIESWWGPDGFTVKVLELDLRAEGHLTYAMTATAPPQVAFMKQAGMPLTTRTRVDYTEVTRHRRLAYLNHADFIPGVAPYKTAMAVDLTVAPGGVRMVLTVDPMHDEVWTQRMAAGWESQLGRLTQLLGRRAAR
jgi:uncharacterized protein YndB with AHSA1/START domain